MALIALHDMVSWSTVKDHFGLQMGTNSGPELLLRARPRRAAAAARPARGGAARGGALGPPGGRRAAARRRARSRPTSASRAGWSSTPTRSCSPRATCGAARRGHVRGRTAPLSAAPAPAAAPRRGRCASTSSPATPTSPRSRGARGCARARETLREAPDRALGYPDPRGALGAAPRARRAPAPRPRRRRRPRARSSSAPAPRRRSRCSRACSGAAWIAVEDPGLPLHRAILAAAGASLLALPVDEHGARVEALARDRPRPPCSSRRRTSRRPGSALSPARRAALLAWARAREALVIEDDYDAEFRYDRAPLGALQGLAPDRVAYIGTVSKTLAPALRLGWLVLPARPGGRRRRAEAARRPRLADARPARARAADRMRRLRPPPARGPPALPRAPRRARRRGRRATCPARA